MPWKQETANKDADKHQYTKVGVKDGKVQVMSKVSLTGADVAWAKNKDLIFVPAVRLAGTIADIQAYANASGVDNATLQNAVNQGVYKYDNTVDNYMFQNELANAVAFRKQAAASKKAASPNPNRSPGRPKGSGNKSKVVKSPRGGNDMNSRAGRDAEMHQYTKVGLDKDGKISSRGKVKISGAQKMWEKYPDFLYVPYVRLAGTINDISAYLRAKKFEDSQIQGFINQGVYQKGSSGGGFEAEKDALANYNKMQSGSKDKSPAKPRKKRATRGRSKSPKRVTSKSPKRVTSKSPSRSKAASKGKKGGPRGPRKMTVDQLSTRAQKDADSNQYTKILTKAGKTGPSGKVKITGAERMWESDPQFVYYPNARLAGGYNDINYYLLAAGLTPAEVNQFMANNHSINGVGNSYRAEVNAANAEKAQKAANSPKKMSPPTLRRQNSAGRSSGSTSFVMPSMAPSTRLSSGRSF